jgi:hypothetical protein
MRLSVPALLVLPGEVRGTAGENKLQPAGREPEPRDPPDHFRSPAIRHGRAARPLRGLPASSPIAPPNSGLMRAIRPQSPSSKPAPDGERPPHRAWHLTASSPCADTDAGHEAARQACRIDNLRANGTEPAHQPATCLMKERAIGTGRYSASPTWGGPAQQSLPHDLLNSRSRACHQHGGSLTEFEDQQSGAELLICISGSAEAYRINRHSESAIGAE